MLTGMRIKIGLTVLCCLVTIPSTAGMPSLLSTGSGLDFALQSLLSESLWMIRMPTIFWL